MSPGQSVRVIRCWLNQHTLRRGNRLRRGQATLEMLVVLLMLIPLIFGSIELARAVAIHSALDSGTEIATRAVSLDPSSPQIAWAYGVVDSTVKSNIMGTSGLNPTITVTPVDLNGQDVSLQSLRFGDPFCLRSAAIFTPSIPFIAPQTITIRVEHCAIMEGVLN